MKLHFAEPTPATVVVTIIGKSLDINHVQTFKDQIGPVIGPRQHVLIDLSSLQHVDSAGLGALLSVLRRVKMEQRELRLYGLNAQVTALFHIVRLHRIVPIFNNLADALKGLDSGAPPRG